MRDYYFSRSPLGTTMHYILSTEDDMSPTVKRLSRIFEGEPEKRVKGDNEVSHYRMTVTQTAVIESTVPALNLSVHEQRDTSRYRFKEYQFVDWEASVNNFVYETGYVRWYPGGGGRSYVSKSRYENTFTYDNVRRRWKCHSEYYYGTTYDTTDKSVIPPEHRTDDTYGPWYTKGGSMESIVITTHGVLPFAWIDHMNAVLADLHTVSDSEALSECIRNTIQELTTYDTNSYANLLELISFIKSLKEASISNFIKSTKSLYDDLLKATGNSLDNVKDIAEARKIGRRALRKRSVKAASNAWLQYRYAYSTTKADFEQAVKVRVGEYLGKVDNRVLRGSIDISGGTLKIKMRLRDNTRANFDKFLIAANQYGLFPGLYNLWDMMPFSFIADWVAPLGDELQDIDQSVFFRYYEVEELLVSRKIRTSRKEVFGDTVYEYYERRLLTAMPQWEIYEDPKGASGKTVVKRTLDGISLAVGFI